MEEYRKILYEQLALDFCCSPEDVGDSANHFTEYRPLDGRRKWQGQKDCYLKIAVINGKLLFSGNPAIIDWCREQYLDTGGEWFFEFGNMNRIHERILQDGYQVITAHPFFIPDNTLQIRNDLYDICWYESEEINRFQGDDRYKNAFSFCEEAPDMIGVSASKDGKILGMAGASCDSDTMWQIGVDIDPDERRHRIASLLVSLLKNEILKRGRLPFYGTSMSHIGSQKVALRAGFVPAWAEMGTSETVAR